MTTHTPPTDGAVEIVQEIINRYNDGQHVSALAQIIDRHIADLVKERDRFRLERDRYWKMILDSCEAMELLVPEAGPHIVRWSKKRNEVIYEKDQEIAALRSRVATLEGFGMLCERAEKFVRSYVNTSSEPQSSLWLTDYAALAPRGGEGRG